MASLAVKYRPQDFDSVVGQETVIKILKRQLETKTFKNAYLFCGPSGDGKTTLARIFAKHINNGNGAPIEIDGASNNGVDNIREIIDESKERAIDAEYKVFIIDEAHMITLAAWNAFLKCLEEPTAFTIFILCTTNPEKIPATILNRVMRFNLTRIATSLIEKRLEYISQTEGYTDYTEACDYISKLSCGGMRDAISNLEKCAGYSNDLSMTNVLQALGNFSYETFFKLTNSVMNEDRKSVAEVIDDVYGDGADLKIFLDQYLDFVLDLDKYCLFKTMDVTKIPVSLEKPKDKDDMICMAYTTGIADSASYFSKLASRVLSVRNMLKYDTSPKDTVEVEFIDMCRGL
jgi:DNA polymerase-3 subunit gamma/tau